eukprot:7784622-Pyramimonas_sp.AAC.1
MADNKTGCATTYGMYDKVCANKAAMTHNTTRTTPRDHDVTNSTTSTTHDRCKRMCKHWSSHE